MGEAQVTSQLQNAVKAVKTIVEEEEEKLKEKTGLEVNFTEDKVQDYMQQVVQEMLKRKSLSKNTS
jgi:Tfp pilus assembly PilM family ATPase